MPVWLFPQQLARLSYLGLLALSAGAVSLAPVRAEDNSDIASTNQFLVWYDQSKGKERILYLTSVRGLQDGFVWANAHLEAGGKDPLYCQPRGLRLTSEQVINLVRTGVTDNPMLGRMPLGAVMLSVLQRSFPCAPQ